MPSATQSINRYNECDNWDRSIRSILPKYGVFNDQCYLCFYSTMSAPRLSSWDYRGILKRSKFYSLPTAIYLTWLLKLTLKVIFVTSTLNRTSWINCKIIPRTHNNLIFLKNPLLSCKTCLAPLLFFLIGKLTKTTGHTSGMIAIVNINNKSW